MAQVWTGGKLRPEALAVLAGLADVIASRVGERSEWYAEAAEADAIIVAGGTQITGAVMDCLGARLRMVARPGIGVDAIDLEAATQRGILVLNTPDGPTESTAEHAVALLLNLCKQVSVGDRLMRSGQPGVGPGQVSPGVEVAGIVLGLIGLGRIGSRVATIARVLGMQVMAFDPFLAPEKARELGVELVPSLAELLPRARVISLHCPSTPETYRLLNAEMLSLLPRGSYVVNVSRGALIDEAALLDALCSGHLAGAALDVFDPEPPPASHPLFALPNTICTPHIGSYTGASVSRMQVMICEQIANVLRGERPTNLVNPAVWGHHRR
ncbi:MAG TPA: hydroxyacid dehydrogenase [Ktedonobacteraceae bacterium]